MYGTTAAAVSYCCIIHLQRDIVTEMASADGWWGGITKDSKVMRSIFYYFVPINFAVTGGVTLLPQLFPINYI